MKYIRCMLSDAFLHPIIFYADKTESYSIRIWQRNADKTHLDNKKLFLMMTAHFRSK